MSVPACTLPGRFLHVYCDESRQMAERYMVIGGLIIDREYEAQVAAKMTEFRRANGMNAELKWTKVSDQKLAQYKELVDLFFSVSECLHFKSIVVDTHEIDNRRYNRNDAELGFYKLMYQFLLHSFGSYLRPEDRCVIFLDQRTTSHYKLSTLCAILNNGLHKKHPYLRGPVRNIQAIDSRCCEFVQIADVLMGAIGYCMNEMHLRASAKGAKVALAKHIAQCAGLTNLQQPTPRTQRHFAIWHFHFRNPRTK